VAPDPRLTGGSDTKLSVERRGPGVAGPKTFLLRGGSCRGRRERLQATHGGAPGESVFASLSSAQLAVIVLSLCCQETATAPPRRMVQGVLHIGQRSHRNATDTPKRVASATPSRLAGESASTCARIALVDIQRRPNFRERVDPYLFQPPGAGSCLASPAEVISSCNGYTPSPKTLRQRYPPPSCRHGREGGFFPRSGGAASASCMA